MQGEVERAIAFVGATLINARDFKPIPTGDTDFTMSGILNGVTGHVCRSNLICMRERIDGSTMPAQAYFMQLARRCRFLSHHTLDLRVARELRILGDELEHKAREAQTAADAAVPAVVQAYAPR